MNQTKLYIIGNGFDLWHGIPSSLGDFKKYAAQMAQDVYREVEEYLPVDENWGDLELALAELDAEQLTENLGHYMTSYSNDDWSDSGHHDFQYEVTNVVERLSTNLHALFADWVRKLPIPTRYNAPKLLSHLDTQALFLTFNYTNTLSSVYGVNPSHILFIHGCAAQPNDELVLGHAWDPQSRLSLNDRPDIEEVDTRLVEANNIIDEYFKSTFKNSADIIARYSPSFSELASVEQVFVLGHSLSSVDAAYFHVLLDVPAVANAQWLIAIRADKEQEEKKQRLAEYGLCLDRTSFMLWAGA